MQSTTSRPFALHGLPVAAAILALASAAMSQTAPQAAASAPAQARIDYPTVAAARAALEALDGNGAVVTHPDGWMIANEPLAAAQWSFTPVGHYAYPALVRRTVRRSTGGAVSIEAVSLCEAQADACARLLVEFENLNDRISQSVRARARQGSTPPR